MNALSVLFLILAVVIGWYVWLVYGTAFIFPVDRTLFDVLLVTPIVGLVGGAVVTHVLFKVGS